MELVLFGLVLLLLMHNSVNAVDNSTAVDVVYADFKTYSDHYPYRCFVCKDIMLPMTSARRSKVFTCSHGKYVHHKCRESFFASQGEEKRCAHSACKRAPLINPNVNFEDRVRFYKVYQTMSPGHRRPGTCEFCQGLLYGNEIGSLRMSAETFGVSSTCGRIYHTTCAERIDRCACGDRLKRMEVSLEGFLNVPATNQIDLLERYYSNHVLPNRRQSVPSYPRARRDAPILSNFNGFLALQPYMVGATPFRTPRRQDLRSNPSPSYQLQSRQMHSEARARAQLQARARAQLQDTARATYRRKLVEIVKLDKEHENDTTLTECTICANVIVGEVYVSASTKYIEELFDGETPPLHFEEMHEACVDYHITRDKLCPICRRNIKLVENLPVGN